MLKYNLSLEIIQIFLKIHLLLKKLRFPILFVIYAENCTLFGVPYRFI